MTNESDLVAFAFLSRLRYLHQMDSDAPLTIITSDELSRDAARALAAAAAGRVVITDGGAPTHVLLSYDSYQALSGSGISIVDMLQMREGADIEFDPPPRFR